MRMEAEKNPRVVKTENSVKLCVLCGENKEYNIYKHHTIMDMI